MKYKDNLCSNKKKMSSVRVAVVTGSNKGIGYWIVKGLCKSFDGIVYLTGKRFENFFASRFG